MNKTIQALNDLENGNITSFKSWLKKCSKRELVIFIGNYGYRHADDGNCYRDIIDKIYTYQKTT